MTQARTMWLWSTGSCEDCSLWGARTYQLRLCTKSHLKTPLMRLCRRM